MDPSESSSNKGKAHDINGANGVGFRPQPAMVAVVPPRQEDLQKSYEV